LIHEGGEIKAEIRVEPVLLSEGIMALTDITESVQSPTLSVSSPQGHASKSVPGMAVRSITLYQEGFIVSMHGSSALHAFQKVHTDGSFNPLPPILMPEYAKLLNVALSPSEDMLMSLTDRHQLLSVQFGPTMFDGGNPCTLSVTPLPYHQGSILALDTCMAKPLLASSSTDCTIKIWHLIERQLEFSKSFTEAATHLAFHPSGAFMIATFPSCFRLFSVLHTDLQVTWSFNSTNSQFAVFTPGGDRFVLVYDNHIKVPIIYRIDNRFSIRGRAICFPAEQHLNENQNRSDGRMIVNWCWRVETG
jgi:hypothetical protein